MNEAILKQWANQAMATAPWPDERFPPSPYYRFLRIAAENMHPNLSVELGVCGGGGSFHLAIGWPSGMVIGIDHAEDHKENTDFIKEQCPNFELLIGDSVKVASNGLIGIGIEYQVDILFIDTIHTYERTMLEFNTWQPYLSNNAIVCFDDLFRPGMNKVWNELPDNKVRLDMLHTGAANGGGFGVVWT